MDYPTNLGAVEDNRTPKERAKDYKAAEVVAGASPLSWKPLVLNDVKVLFPKNQLQRSSCVAQTIATTKSRNQFREEGNLVDVSPTMPYNGRSNKPGLGMTAIDANLYSIKKGASLEAICPSEGLSEGAMNEATITKLDLQIGQILRAGGFFGIDFDMDSIARIMESDRKRGMGVPVMLWFQFPINGEWWLQIPQEGNGNGAQTAHSVCGIEYGMYEGEKAFAIQESAGVNTTFEPNKKNIRIVKESYLKKHIIFAAYERDLSNDWRDGNAPEKPIHWFSVPLNFSEAVIINPEVKILQNILKFEGVLAKDIESTGYYGALTAKAVLAFQVKHGIPTDNNGGRRAGEKTLAKLNELYGK